MSRRGYSNRIALMRCDLKTGDIVLGDRVWTVGVCQRLGVRVPGIVLSRRPGRIKRRTGRGDRVARTQGCVGAGETGIVRCAGLTGAGGAGITCERRAHERERQKDGEPQNNHYPHSHFFPSVLLSRHADGDCHHAPEMGESHRVRLSMETHPLVRKFPVFGLPQLFSGNSVLPSIGISARAGAFQMMAVDGGSRVDSHRMLKFG